MQHQPKQIAHCVKVLTLAWVFCSVTHAAQGKVVEEQVDVPVTVTDMYGKPTSQSIKLTVFREDTRTAPQPLLVLNHGRAVEAVARAAFGRARYPDISRWLVVQGFVVALPTRVGYGISGGEDVEYSGTCTRKNYPPGYAAATEQVRAALAAMYARSDVLPNRTVVLGQSYGGAVAINSTAAQLPGVVAGINFAGGGGGNPDTQPGQPCAPQLLEKMFANYGQTSRVPTLWVYTENDKFMGPRYPLEWFVAFQAAGGVGELVQLPPFGDDGHTLFVKGANLWRPIVADFLNRLGFDIKP